MRSAFLFVCLGIVSMADREANGGYNLVSNGDFETGDFTDWNYTSKDGFSYVDTGFSQSGSYAAFFGDTQADGGGSISQLLATSSGAGYVFTFWFAGDGDNPSGFAAIVGGNTVFQLTNPPYDTNYNLYTFAFTATSTSTLIQFDEYDDVGYINLDNVSVEFASVPEPTSIIPLGIGMLTLTGYTVYRGKRDQ